MCRRCKCEALHHDVLFHALWLKVSPHMHHNRNIGKNIQSPAYTQMNLNNVLFVDRRVWHQLIFCWWSSLNSSVKAYYKVRKFGPQSSHKGIISGRGWQTMPVSVLILPCTLLCKNIQAPQYYEVCGRYWSATMTRCQVKNLLFNFSKTNKLMVDFGTKQVRNF